MAPQFQEDDDDDDSSNQLESNDNGLLENLNNNQYSNSDKLGFILNNKKLIGDRNPYKLHTSQHHFQPLRRQNNIAEDQVEEEEQIVEKSDRLLEQENQIEQQQQQRNWQQQRQDQKNFNDQQDIELENRYRQQQQQHEFKNRLSKPIIEKIFPPNSYNKQYNLKSSFVLSPNTDFHEISRKFLLKRSSSTKSEIKNRFRSNQRHIEISPQRQIRGLDKNNKNLNQISDNSKKLLHQYDTSINGFNGHQSTNNEQQQQQNIGERSHYQQFYQQQQQLLSDTISQQDHQNIFENFDQSQQQQQQHQPDHIFGNRDNGITVEQIDVSRIELTAPFIGILAVSIVGIIIFGVVLLFRLKNLILNGRRKNPANDIIVKDDDEYNDDQVVIKETSSTSKDGNITERENVEKLKNWNCKTLTISQKIGDIGESLCDTIDLQSTEGNSNRKDEKINRKRQIRGGGKDTIKSHCRTDLTDINQLNISDIDRQTDKKLKVMDNGEFILLKRNLNVDENVEKTSNMADEMDMPKEEEKAKYSKSLSRCDNFNTDDGDVDQLKMGTNRKNLVQTSFHKLKIKTPKTSIDSRLVNFSNNSCSLSSNTINLSGQISPIPIATMNFGRKPTKSSTSSSSTPPISPLCQTTIPIAVTSSPIPTPSHQQIFPQFAFRNTDKVIYRSLSLTAATASISPPPATPIQYKSTATIVERPILTKSSSLIVTSSSSSNNNSKNHSSNSNNRLRRLSSTERQQQQSQISIHQQQQNRQHSHLEQQHQGRRYSYRRSGGSSDTNEDQQETSPIVPCAPPTTPHFYHHHHHQQITNTTQAVGGQTQSQSLSSTPNHRQSYSRSNSSESKISKNFDIRPSDDKENEIPAGGELYSPKMKLSEHVLAQQNSPRIFESSSSAIHGGGGISTTMTRFSFSPKLIQNNNESSPIMVPAIYTSTSSTSPSAATSTILATPVTIAASSTGITHSASPLLSSAIYKHGNYFKFPEVDCFTPDKSRTTTTTTTTSASAIITGNTLGNSTNKNDTPPTLTATSGPNQQQSGGNSGSGNLSATTRRARLKSISLDSDGAKLVEDNLGIPVEELIEIANQSPTLPDDCFTFEQPSAIGNLSISQDNDDDHIQRNGDKNDHVLSNYGERKSSITLSPPPLATPEIVTTITNEIPRKKSIGDTETKYNRKNKNNLTINISRTIDDDIIINDEGDDDEDDLSLGGRKANDNLIIGSDEALIYTSGNKNSGTPTPKTPTLTQTKQKAISLDSSDTNIIYCLPSSSSSITNQHSNLTGLQPRSTASLLHVSSISMPTTPKRQQQQKNSAHYQGLNHLHHGQQHGMHHHNNQHHHTNQQQQQMMFHHHHGGMVLPATAGRRLVSTVTSATGGGKQIKKPPKLLSLKSHSTASVTSVISPAPSTGSSTSSSATSFDHPQSKGGNSGGGPIGFISKLGSFNENTIDDDDVDEFYLENVVECCPSGNGGMQGSGSTNNIIVHDDDSDYDYHTDSILPYGGGGGSGIHHHHHHHHQHQHQHHQHNSSHHNQQHYQSLSTIATTSSSSFLGSNLQNQKCSTLSLSNNNLKTLPEVMTLSDFSVANDNLPVMDVTTSSAGHEDGNNQFYRDQQQKPHLNVDEQKLSSNALPLVKPVRSNILQRRGSNHSLTLNLNGSLGNLTKSLSVSNYSLGNSQYSLTGSNYNLNQHQNLMTSASSSTGIGGVNCMPVLTTTNKNLSTASGTVIYSSNGNITTPISKKNLLQRRGSNTSLTLNLKGSSCANLSRFNSHSSLNINQQHQQLLQQSYNNNYHLGSTSGMSTTGGGGGGGGQIKKGLLERRNSNVSLTLNIQNRALSISNCNLRGSACSLSSTNTNPNEYGGGEQQNIRKQPNLVQHLNDYDQQHNSQQHNEQHQQEQFNINFELIKQQRKFLSSENLNHITQCSKLNQTHVRNSTKTCFGSVSDLKPHLHQIYPLGKQQPGQQQQHTFIFMDENNPDTIDQTYCSSGIENDGLPYPAQISPPSDLSNIAIGSMPPPPPPPPLTAYRKANFEQTNLCSCTGLRNITTKPLSPQSTSEDFKMYLANIQFLQNATNILNDVHLRKLNYIFDKSYNTGHSGGHGDTVADHDSGILPAELPIGSREDIPQSLEAASNAKVAAQLSENVDNSTISRLDDAQATLIQISDTDDDDDVDDDQIRPSIDEQKMMLRNLHQEFWDLPTNYQEKPLVFGSQAKNRYKTILPNEHSRVILECEPGSLQEPYINANFIKGPDFTQNSYIATQGPMPNTLYEFWLMICQNVNKISNINKMKCSNNQLTSTTMINSTDIQPSTSAGISTTTTTTLLDQQSTEMSPESAMMMSTRSQKIVMLTNFVESNRQKCSIYFPVEANDIILITSSNEKIDNRDNLLSSVYDKYMNLNQHIINDEIIIDDKNFIKKMPKLNCFIIKNAGLITKNGYTIRKLICLYCRFIECISYDDNTIKTTDTSIDCKDPDNQTTSLTMYQKCMKFICYHYWFPDWPDHRSPDDIDVLLDMSLHLLDGQCWNEFNNMLILNNKFNIIDNLPLPIIHCSAGIGRTGCLAAILNGLRQIRLSTQITNNLTSSCSSINSINYRNDNSKNSFDNKDNCNINDNLNMNSTNGNRLNNKKISETSGSGNYDNDKQKKSDNNYQNRSSQINIMKKINLKQIHVDILGIVCNLRLQRGGMVQNSEQYELIHRALCLYQKRLIENLDNHMVIENTTQQHSSENHEDDKEDHNTTQSSLSSSVIHH